LIILYVKKKYVQFEKGVTLFRLYMSKKTLVFLRSTRTGPFLDSKTPTNN